MDVVSDQGAEPRLGSRRLPAGDSRTPSLAQPSWLCILEWAPPWLSYPCQDVKVMAHLGPMDTLPAKGSPGPLSLVPSSKAGSVVKAKEPHQVRRFVCVFP